MPFQTPEENTAVSVATLGVRDDSANDGETVPQVSLTTGQFGSGDASVESVEVLVQKIIDAINAHPDLSVVAANRVYRIDQLITPTD